MFEDFQNLLLNWLRQHNHLEFINSIGLSGPALHERKPDLKLLWDRLIRTLIPKSAQPFHFYHPHILEAIVSDLCGLSQYTSQQKIHQLVELHITPVFNQLDPAVVKDRMVEFHNHLPMWEDGTLHHQVQDHRYDTVNKLKRIAGFEDDWEAASFLSNCGYWYPSSRASFKAWLKYSGESPDDAEWTEWLELLRSCESDPKRLYLLDFAFDKIFGAWPLPEIPFSCDNGKSCLKCPLIQNCRYRLSQDNSENNVTLENLLRLDDTDEVTTERLIPYLAGNRWSQSPIQQLMVDQFPEWLQSGVTDGPFSAEDEQFFLFLKGLQSLSERLNQENAPVDQTIFNKSEIIFKLLSTKLAKLKQEAFYTLILDNKYRQIHLKHITRGTLNQSLVHPRECAV